MKFVIDLYNFQYLYQTEFDTYEEAKAKAQSLGFEYNIWVRNATGQLLPYEW